MSKVSKMAANRLAVSRTVHSSLAVHGREISHDLAQALFPDGVPAKLTLDKFLQGVADVLRRADDEVSAADQAHAAELADDAEPRHERDAAAAALSEKLISLRDTLSGLFGQGLLHSYGLDEPISASPQQLLHRAGAIVKLLRTRPLTEKPLHPGVTLHTELLAESLHSASQALERALHAVRREEREAQLTLQRKGRAAESWQTAYQGVSSTFYGLCLLAGRRDLAARITPTARRRAGLPDAGDIPAPANQPAPTDPPAAPVST